MSPEALQHRAAQCLVIAVGRGSRRRLLHHFERPFVLALAGKDAREREGELHMRRFEGEPLFDEAPRLLYPPLLEKQRDIDLARIGVRGLGFQDRAKEVLRLGHPALVDERHGAAEIIAGGDDIGGDAVAFIKSHLLVERFRRLRRLRLGFRRRASLRGLDQRRLDGEGKLQRVGHRRGRGRLRYCSGRRCLRLRDRGGRCGWFGHGRGRLGRRNGGWRLIGRRRGERLEFELHGHPHAPGEDEDEHDGDDCPAPLVAFAFAGRRGPRLAHHGIARRGERLAAIQILQHFIYQAHVFLLRSRAMSGAAKPPPARR